MSKKRGSRPPARERHELPPLRLARAPALVALALAAAGAAISVYLAYVHVRLHREIGWRSGCDINEHVSCDAVALSPWSELFGMPIAAWGAWFYTLLFVLVLIGRLRPWFPRSPALVLLFAGSFATGLSVVLGVVSATSIGVLCPLCAVLYGISLGLLGTGIWATRSAGEPLRESLRGERRFWRQRQGRVALALGVPALVLFVAWGVWPRGFAPVANLCQFTRARAAAGETGPIELVVYSDFQCPWCEKANDALERLRASGKARVEHRHYPLDQECNRAMRRQMHPGACTQAKAAICAEKLGRGSEMAGRIFSERLSDPAALAEAAAGLGLERAVFEACLSSRETALELDRHMDAADAQGVTGTPAVFVNGRKLEGMLDAENVACLLRG